MQKVVKVGSHLPFAAGKAHPERPLPQHHNTKKENGGETGIRTLETVSRLHTFQACAFDHSATSPWGVS